MPYEYVAGGRLHVKMMNEHMTQMRINVTIVMFWAQVPSAPCPYPAFWPHEPQTMK